MFDLKARRGQLVRLALALACISALALTVAACGSSSSSSSGSATSEAASGETETAASTEAGPEKAGKTAEAGSSPKETIGWVDLIASGAMQRRFQSYFEAAAEYLGWKFELQDAKGDPVAANKLAITMLNEGVSALVDSCADSAPMRPAIELAKQKGIPIVQVGCEMTDEEAFDASFPIPDEAAATKLGEYVASQIGQGSQVAMLDDTTILSGKIRTEAIKEALSSKGAEIVGEQSVDLTDVVGASRKTTSAYLTANPELKAIIAIYDFFAAPAGETIKSAGKGNQVGVYSFFADSVNAPYMEQPNSPLKAVVDGPVEQVSLLAADQLLAYFEGKEDFNSAAVSELEIPLKIYTAEDLPKLGPDYLSPYPVKPYLEKFEQKWEQEYGIK